MWKCRFCCKEFDFNRATDKGNHAKHCDKNPNKFITYDKIKKSSDKRFGKRIKFTMICEKCEKPFSVKEREKLHPEKEKYFCSRSCANSTGGKAKAQKYHSDDVAYYRTVAFRHHEKKCVVCGENKIVAVHHLNENHEDNDPKNLLPICPTHHQYIHSRYKCEIIDKVEEYLKVKWG